ncbi:UNVERIFIED_CONTAM: hypothetical protein Scaly_2984700 [Sesamum calycinum]|uniref:SWIM-type domain-containing protein n=1 Tax=Sesamum calycinum TaxID=2727403 RepID=A0AAW2KK54_9LAMI
MSIHYGGSVTKTGYVGGQTYKFDNVEYKHVGFGTLNEYGNYVGIRGEKTYFVKEGNLLKQITSNSILQEIFVKFQPLREVDIYINGQIVADEGDESEGDEVVGGLNDNESEGDEVVGGLNDNESSSGGEEFDDSDNTVIKETDEGKKSEAREEDFDAEGLRVDDTDVDNWSGRSSAQYALLWDYADEVKRSNPGSTVILGTNQNLFDRFYVCLHALRMNFLAGCRPVICVDGCHLKGPHGGVLLAAVGIDPNNNFFPICYAVVMRENREIWEWFLTLLKMDLHIENDCNYTFMSDKQKGLVGALQELFPNAEHRFCVRHLHSNFKSNGFRGLAFKNGLWKAARATTVNQFNERIKELKDLDEGAYAWFNDKPPKEWSRSHFSNYSSVDLENGTCGCRKWDLSGIPCKHAAYQHPIFPINGRDEWKKSDLSPPVPPKAVKRVGRPPKSSRRLEVDEPVQKNKKRRSAPMKEGSSRIKRQQTTVKCGKCGGQGHNARGCATKTASNEPVPDASSQVPPIEQQQKKQVRRKCKGIIPVNGPNLPRPRLIVMGLDLDPGPLS